jgi:hypothetical protein
MIVGLAAALVLIPATRAPAAGAAAVRMVQTTDFSAAKKKKAKMRKANKEQYMRAVPSK